MRSLFSWLDVEQTLLESQAANSWPAGLVGASAYHDGLEVRVSTEADRDGVKNALREWFGDYYRSEGIYLESLPDHPRILPVSFEAVDEASAPPLKWRPSFARTAVVSGQVPAQDWPVSFPPESPRLIAFYSYKGGVGRTLHLLALLGELSKRDKSLKVLVVDADMEAPGISALASASGFGEPTISLVDFLAMVHGEPQSKWEEIFELVGRHLRSQTLPITLGTGGPDQFFLPTFRDAQQALRLELRPEHLTQNLAARWRIGDIFSSLGKAVGADVVLIDLRAGLSELASPFLFDPRIQRVIVSTLSLQSIDGTRLVLQQLAKASPPMDRIDLSDPVVLLTFIPKEMSGSKQLEQTREKLLDLYPDSPGEGMGGPDRLRIEETPFLGELLVVTSLVDALESLRATSIAKVSKALMEEWIPLRQQPHVPLLLPGEGKAKLAAFAKNLEFAESGMGTSFLVTVPLRSLAQRFQSESPVAVVIGAKGAGKTYTYLQVVRKQWWSDFVSKTLGTSSPISWGRIWPFLHPKKLEQSAMELIEECVDAAMSSLAILEEPWQASEAITAIDNALSNKNEEESQSWWRDQWFHIIATSLRMEVGSGEDPARKIVEELAKRKQRLVVLIDGLEEMFLQIAENTGQQTALRALIEDVPNRLREFPNRPLGLIVFVRADIVRASIRQNVGQFERHYEPYSLHWDRDHALRLAVWINQQCELLPEDPAEMMTGDAAAQVLYPIWGRKLGHDQSREARTAEYVIAALSDLNGLIQARDLVRLLRHAAENPAPTPLPDRLLGPASIRSAVQPCSEEKVRETEEEIPDLKAVFQKLRGVPGRKIPFDSSTFGLSREELKLLKETGVVLEEGGEYYMPEIFRHGLGFQFGEGARPRVLSLARRARHARSS